MDKHIGHPSQMYGVEEMRLVGGKADVMRQKGILEFLDAGEEKNASYYI